MPCQRELCCFCSNSKGHTCRCNDRQLLPSEGLRQKEQVKHICSVCRSSNHPQHDDYGPNTQRNKERLAVPGRLTVVLDICYKGQWPHQQLAHFCQPYGCHHWVLQPRHYAQWPFPFVIQTELPDPRPCIAMTNFEEGKAQQHSTAQHSTAQHSTAQHSTAQHSTAQHSTARHSTAQHRTILYSIGRGATG